MIYEIMASLRLHLDSEVPELSKVQFIYDGVSLTDLTKPFVTIMQLAEPTEMISAGRTSFRETYNFQVGVFSDSFAGELKIRSSVKEALQTEVPFYNDLLTLTGDTFICDVSDYTPIRNTDTADATHDFHGYFDVSVTILRNVGSKEFTQ